MQLVHLRVDDRLIHGQVTVGWSRHVGANRIIVANDQAAGNRLQRGMLEMIPIAGIQVSVMSIDEFLRAATSDELGAARVFLIVGNPIDLLRLVEGGLSVSEVTVGNVGYREGRKRLSKEVHADETELDALRQLDQKGISLHAQWTPGSPKVDLNRELGRTG